MRIWKKVLDHYNSWKLGHKLLCAFTLASIIPLLLIQIFAFQVNRKQMTEKIDELMVSNLTQIAERVKPEYGSIYKTCYIRYIKMSR